MLICKRDVLYYTKGNESEQHNQHTQSKQQEKTS